VPHRRLLLKLQGYGISDNYIKWISSFLTSRMMRVGVSGEFSQWVEVVSGVPQGSVLGPVLFILYVNDLPQWIKNSMRMFADDAKVWTRINSQEDSLSLQNDLNSLSKRSDMWLLGLNPVNSM